MTDPLKTDQTITCPICGSDFAPAAMVWSKQNEQPLCPQCLAEEESCGCADD